MALTATLTYDAATRTLTVLETSPPAGASYTLSRVRPGQDNALLAASRVTGGVTYAVPADGVYRLLLARVADATADPDITADTSAELLHTDTEAHRQALAHTFDLLTARTPVGHPLADAQRLLVRQLEAAYCVAESNPVEADRLLTAAHFPK